MKRRNLIVYGHLNLNLLDGSATWLTSLVETLAMTNSTVHLLLRVKITTDRLLKRLVDLPNVVIHHGVTDEAQYRLSDSEAVTALEELARLVDADAIITRGRDFCERVARSDELSPILWSYVTDFSFPSHLLDSSEEAQLRYIAARSHRLFLQTEDSRSYIESIFDEATGKTLLMTPTVPDDLFKPLAPKQRGGGLRLIYAGKFHPDWQTLEMLSLPSLLGPHGLDVTVTMLGDKFQGDAEWSDAMRSGLTTSEGVTWGGGVGRNEVISQMTQHDIGLSWRTSALDSSLEISTKLLEYCAAGTPPLANRTRAHEQLLGADYPLLLDDESVESVSRALLSGQSQLEELRVRAQEAARQYSSTVTAARLEEYLADSERPVRVSPAGHMVDALQANRPKLLGSEFSITLLDLARRARPHLALELLTALLKRDKRFHLTVRCDPPWEDETSWREPATLEYFHEFYRRSALAGLAEHVTFIPAGRDLYGWLRTTGWVFTGHALHDATGPELAAFTSGCIPLRVHSGTSETHMSADPFRHETIGDMVEHVSALVQDPTAFTDQAQLSRSRALDCLSNPKPTPAELAALGAGGAL